MMESQEVAPDGMEQENLTRHMAVALMRSRVDEPLSRERAYRLWASLAEEARERFRVDVRPLLPFVIGERKRADAWKDMAGRLASKIIAVLEDYPPGAGLSRSRMVSLGALIPAYELMVKEEGG